MRHYIIDTNFVHLDYFLRGTNITVLTQSAKNLGHIVYMPIVVFDELVKQYSDEVAAQSAAYSKFLKGQNRINENKITYSTIDFDKQKKNYENLLAKKCAALGIKRIDYPSIPHREVVKRELAKRKPFKDSTKGYRDSLIWLSLLQFGQGMDSKEPIVLLSQNTDDFGKGKNTLHPDLVEDCRTCGMQDGRVTLISDFKDFIQNQILPAAEKMEKQIHELLKTFAVGKIDIRGILDQYCNKESVQGFFAFDPEDGLEPLAPGFYENIEVMFLEVPTFSIYDVRKLSGSVVLISVTVDVRVNIDCFVYKGDLPLIDSDSMPYIFDFDRNDHYVAASDNADMTIQYDILVDADFSVVNNVDQFVTHIKYATGYEYKA